MIVRFFEAFDDHCLTYLFLIGFTIGLFGHGEGSAISCGAVMLLVGGLAWYSIKAVFITGCTIKNWDRDHPGEPMFRSGGLTEYDQEQCRQTGAAVAEAIRKSRRDDDSK